MYTEKAKSISREIYLSRAIQDLTERRKDSFLIIPDEINALYEESFKFLETINVKYDKDDNSKLTEFLDKCRYNSDSRNASSLKVLFLCGERPSNDINVLRKNGIQLENITAVESNREIYHRAVQDLINNNIPIRIYHGDLAEYIHTKNEVYDIIYIDACSSFCKTSPNTHKPIFELFLNGSTAPLSVLITNFAEVKDTEDYHAGLMASYFAGRYNDYPAEAWRLGQLDPEILQAEPENLKCIIQNNISTFYSDFITRFIIDLGRYLIPNIRALSFDMIWKQMLNKEHVKQLLEKKAYKDPEFNKNYDIYDILQQFDSWMLLPRSYPLYAFFNLCSKLTGSTAFSDSIKTITINNKKLGSLIPIASALDSLAEGHWNIVTKQFLSAILGIWIESPNEKVFCDLPFPHLLINSHLGTFSKPVHFNVKKMMRSTYIAKKTTMYMDYFVMDNCQEFYDWFPSIDLTRNFFASIPNQLIARIIMDRLGRQDWSCTTHPFRGSSLFAIDDHPLEYIFDLPKRTHLTESIL